jgi:hypothetical protein
MSTDHGFKMTSIALIDNAFWLFSEPCNPNRLTKQSRNDYALIYTAHSSLLWHDDIYTAHSGLLWHDDILIYTAHSGLLWHDDILIYTAHSGLLWHDDILIYTAHSSLLWHDDILIYTAHSCLLWHDDILIYTAHSGLLWHDDILICFKVINILDDLLIDMWLIQFRKTILCLHDYKSVREMHLDIP